MCIHPEIIYVITPRVYEDYNRLVDSGVFPDSPAWETTCQDRALAATTSGNEDEARHWRMVLEFGSRYGCNFVAAIEVDGRLFREAELPFDVPAEKLKRVIIGAEPFNVADGKSERHRLGYAVDSGAKRLRLHLSA